MADMTGTTMANWLPEQWSELATITYRSNTVLWDLIDRRWEPEIGVGRGDTVNIPGFTQNTSATKRSTFGTGASITFDAVTESQVQLVVNTMAYKAFRIPAELSVQSMPKYVDLLTNGIGQAVALQADSDIASDNSNGLDAFTAIGTDNVDITEDTLFTAETNLDDNNAPAENRHLVVSPASKASLMKIEAFRNSLYGGAVGNLPGDRPYGLIGSVYSYDVWVSNNLESGTSGKKNALFQMEAIAGAMQRNITMVADVNIEDGIFNQVAGYAVYGIKLVKTAFGREVDGK
jgi:hypothetical protein